jgi:hypothetical protein
VVSNHAVSHVDAVNVILANEAAGKRVTTAAARKQVLTCKGVLL